MSEQRDLRADLELCNKATHGKWQASYDDDIKDDVRVCQVENGECVCCLALMGNYDYDLGEWHYGDMTEWRANADFIAAARTGWPEAIERAIVAESLIENAGKELKEWMRQVNETEEKLKEVEEHNEHLIWSYEEYEAVTKAEIARLQAENAALREENDLQRHSIQQLSAQVVELREGIENIKNYCLPAACIVSYANGSALMCASLLAKPNLGADLLAKIERLEAVAEAAKEFDRQIMRELKTLWEKDVRQALVDLEGEKS